jgi:hypothetical protein
MVTTAPEIMGDYENGALHYVDHIAPEKRITSITFARDKEIEIQMAERLILANEFYNEVLTQLNNK